ncbi:serine/threonine-protein kinase [Streptomyces guryensis]|uniref:non-specific serine/threonine protein kinase n=1 Tax=Streptomyces guryensis TaxID=2886947 RepID=A0A9Q3VPH9_9ACTN|nr:serine/threonine-protein kinase [Streptomyces guryensis]MCD9874670.1 serine/threonine protein kinase [Streptomyces guryensis]
MNDGDTDRRVVDGRFELESRVGGGGMGTVWRARDLLLHRSVAVKEVRPADPDLAEYDPDSARMLRERVLREGRALARVQHPNVVTIHHIVDGGEGTYPWIVMELVEGGSLADRLARAPMTPAEAARLGRGVLDALRAAHAAGVQHRDVKPANVLLRTDGRPVLTDCGIAAIRDSTALTATGSIIGTADYMAPERVTGGDGGPAADLWSLAMMLYVAVEGHHPLRRGTTLATLAAVLHEDVPPPRQGGALAPLLAAVLVRDPGARPDAETTDRMLAAAEQAGDEPTATSYPLAPARNAVPAPIPTPSDTVVPSLDRQVRVRRAALASVAAGAVLVGGITWVAWPDGNGNKASASTTTGGQHSTPASTPRADTPLPSPATRLATGMLTPDGIRMALKAIEDKTGRDTFGDLAVYPEYVSVKAMVPGSRTRYDSYTYHPGRGVEKGPLNGTLMGTEPVSLKNYRWDLLPALLTLAEQKLNVDKPMSRYLLLQAPSRLSNTPAGMAVYLSDDYATGYVLATPQGKVTNVVPADG